MTNYKKVRTRVDTVDRAMIALNVLNQEPGIYKTGQFGGRVKMSYNIGRAMTALGYAYEKEGLLYPTATAYTRADAVKVAKYSSWLNNQRMDRAAPIRHPERKYGSFWVKLLWALGLRKTPFKTK